MKLSLWLSVCALGQLPPACASFIDIQNTTDVSCFDVSTVPVQDQCSFVRQHCTSGVYKIGRADYLKFYYCSSIRSVSSVLTFGGIFLFFVSLALTASDYLCPNLYSISKFLQLSDNLAGLTLLALGNGAPDVLSTYKALEVEATGLAVSELMGAALFILTVVVGAISWAHPFKVPRFHFVRDIVFYLTISLICLLILLMGTLTYWTSVLLFSTYIVYVAVVLFSHSVLWENVVHRVNISRLRSTYEEESVSDIGDNRLDYFTTDYVPHPSIDSLMASEYQEERDEFDAFLSTHPHNPRDERVIIETGSYGLKLLLRRLSRHASDAGGISSSLTLTNDRPLTATTSSENVTIPVVPDQELTATASDSKVISEHSSVWGMLLPSMDPESSFFSKVYYALTFPTSTILKLTTPNREQAIEYGHSISYNAFNFSSSATEPPLDEEPQDFDYNLDLRLFRIQFVAFPAFVMLACFDHAAVIWAILPFISFSFYGLSLLMPKEDPGLKAFTFGHRFWNHLGSFIGFIASLLWISLFATEIVAILKAMSVIFGISDDVLGATVFALGNSVGDLVSNLIIARMGMPVMAFGACFGGPLLSISSLGFSAAIIMYNNGVQQIPIEFSGPLKSNCFALILALIFLVVYIPLNGWMFDKRVGGALVSIWVGSCVSTIMSGF